MALDAMTEGAEHVDGTRIPPLYLGIAIWSTMFPSTLFQYMLPLLDHGPLGRIGRQGTDHPRVSTRTVDCPCLHRVALLGWAPLLCESESEPRA